jgi:hypothetical protein
MEADRWARRARDARARSKAEARLIKAWPHDPRRKAAIDQWRRTGERVDLGPLLRRLHRELYLEALAEEGMVVVVNDIDRIVLWDRRTTIAGTTPMACQGRAARVRTNHRVRGSRRGGTRGVPDHLGDSDPPRRQRVRPGATA